MSAFVVAKNNLIKDKVRAKDSALDRDPATSKKTREREHHNAFTQTPKGKVFPEELKDFREVIADRERLQSNERSIAASSHLGRSVKADIVKIGRITSCVHGISSEQSLWPPKDSREIEPPEPTVVRVSDRTRHALLRRVYLVHAAQTTVVCAVIHVFVLYPPAARFALHNWWAWIVGSIIIVALYAVMMCGPIRWRTNFPVNATLLVTYTLVAGVALGFLAIDLVKLRGDYTLIYVFLFDPVFIFYELMYLTAVMASCQTKYPLVKTRPLGYLFCTSGTIYKLLLIIAQVALFRTFEPSPPPTAMCIVALVMFELSTMCYFYVLITLTQYMLEGRFDIALDPRNSIAAVLYIQESAFYMIAFYFFSYVKAIVFCIATIIKRKHQPRAKYVYGKYWGSKSKQPNQISERSSKNVIVLR